MLSNRQAVVESQQHATPNSVTDNVRFLNGEPRNADSMSALIEEAGTFQSFHARSRALMDKGIEIQQAIKSNRDLRADSQKQLFKLYGEISHVNPAMHKRAANDSLLLRIKDKINGLDTEHTSLNKEFVAIQSKILKAVKNQRIRLVKGGNKAI